MKIGLKKFNLTVNLKLSLKVDLKKADWNTLINLGTFIVQYYQPTCLMSSVDTCPSTTQRSPPPSSTR